MQHVKLIRRAPSEGARRMAEELGIRMLRMEGSNYRVRPNSIALNWGCTEDPYGFQHYINRPEHVARAVDKLQCLTRLNDAELPTPDFTTSEAEAKEWYNDGSIVMCRTLTRASGGRGIEVMDPNIEGEVEWPRNCPLYTRYFKGYDEWRVHVAGARVADCACKSRPRHLAPEDADYVIRTHDRGWVYARNVRDVPECVTDAAILAVASLELDFGAVDLRYNRREGRCVILEVNTAPGMEGTTVSRVTDAVRRIVTEKWVSVDSA